MKSVAGNFFRFSNSVLWCVDCSVELIHTYIHFDGKSSFSHILTNFSWIWWKCTISTAGQMIASVVIKLCTWINGIWMDANFHFDEFFPSRKKALCILNCNVQYSPIEKMVISRNFWQKFVRVKFPNLTKHQNQTISFELSLF